MGYWGYEPKQGDQPLDMFVFVVDKAIAKSTYNYGKKRLKTWGEKWERAGVFQIALDKGLPVSKEGARQVAKDIVMMLDNGEYQEEWSDPDLFEERAESFLNRLSDLLQRGNNTLGGFRGIHLCIYDPEIRKGG